MANKFSKFAAKIIPKDKAEGFTKIDYRHDGKAYKEKIANIPGTLAKYNPNKAKELPADLRPIPMGKIDPPRTMYLGQALMEQIGNKISPSYHFSRKLQEKAIGKYDPGAELFDRQVEIEIEKLKEANGGSLPLTTERMTEIVDTNTSDPGRKKSKKNVKVLHATHKQTLTAPVLDLLGVSLVRQVV